MGGSVSVHHQPKPVRCLTTKRVADRSSTSHSPDASIKPPFDDLTASSLEEGNTTKHIHPPPGERMKVSHAFSQAYSQSPEALKRVRNQIESDNCDGKGKTSTTHLMQDRRESPQNHSRIRDRLSRRTHRLKSCHPKIYDDGEEVATTLEGKAVDTYFRRVLDALDTPNSDYIRREDLLPLQTSSHGKVLWDRLCAGAGSRPKSALCAIEFAKSLKCFQQGNGTLTDIIDTDDVHRAEQFHLKEKGIAQLRHATEVRPLFLNNAEACLRNVRLVPLPGISNRVKCVAISRRSNLYAVSHRHDPVAHVYTMCGMEVLRLQGHTSPLLSIAFSPDGKYIVTTARENTLMIWSSIVALRCGCITHRSVVTAVAFSYDGSFLYTGCKDNIIRKYAFPSGELVCCTPDFNDAVMGVTVALAAQRTKDEKLFFSHSCDENVLVACTKGFSKIWKLSGHVSLVWHTAFNATDDCCISVCQRKVMVWDTTILTNIASFDSSIASVSNRMAFWTTAVFALERFKYLIFAFTTEGQMLVLDAARPESGIIMDIKCRSSVRAASAPAYNHFVCGDDWGNMYDVNAI